MRTHMSAGMHARLCVRMRLFAHRCTHACVRVYVPVRGERPAPAGPAECWDLAGGPHRPARAAFATSNLLAVGPPPSLFFISAA